MVCIASHGIPIHWLLPTLLGLVRHVCVMCGKAPRLMVDDENRTRFGLGLAHGQWGAADRRAGRAMCSPTPPRRRSSRLRLRSH